jgi:hypothetical protein
LRHRTKLGAGTETAYIPVMSHASETMMVPGKPLKEQPLKEQSEEAILHDVDVLLARLEREIAGQQAAMDALLARLTAPRS